MYTFTKKPQHNKPYQKLGNSTYTDADVTRAFGILCRVYDPATPPQIAAQARDEWTRWFLHLPTGCKQKAQLKYQAHYEATHSEVL